MARMISRQLRNGSETDSAFGSCEARQNAALGKSKCGFVFERILNVLGAIVATFQALRREQSASFRQAPNSLCRFVLFSFCLMMLTTQTGCQLFARFGKRLPVAPVVFQNTPTKDQLIQTLNAQASAVRQLSTNVKVSMDGMPKLRGSLQLERPNRLRLKAGLLGVSEMGVDVGSNDQRFWVWVRASIPGERPAIYYASHASWQNSSMQRSLPLDPAWLIDGVGLVEFQPNDFHEGPFLDPDGRLKLITIRQTGSGPQTRVTLVNSSNAQIEQQAVYDASNRLLAYTNSTDYRVHEDTGVNLPHRVEMHVYQDGGQEMKMVVEAGDYSINALYGDPQKMWAMPNPGDVPAINLAEVSVR